MFNLEEILSNIEKIDKNEYKKYRDHWDSLVHPIGSLGDLEEIGIKYCAILGEIPEKIDKKITLVFSADNGVMEENISSSPQVFTRLLTNEMADGTTGVTALSNSANADVKVIDLGVLDYEGHEKVLDRRISNGTKNFIKEDAMTRDQALKAIEAGYEVACDYIDMGYTVIGTGELGMGNTTTSAAVITAILKQDEHNIVGLGSGVDATQLENKYRTVRDGIDLRKPNLDDPIDVLSKLGGYDIAAMVGVFLACANKKVLAVTDGIITASAALIAYKLNPNVSDYIVGSHIPCEKACSYVYEEIGIRGYLDLHMRLGEGSGCPLFYKILDSSIYCMNNMSLFINTQMRAELQFNIRDNK